MKEKFVEFLLKRINDKISSLRELMEHESEINSHFDDLDEYINTLKEAITESIKL